MLEKFNIKSRVVGKTSGALLQTFILELEDSRDYNKVKKLEEVLALELKVSKVRISRHLGQVLIEVPKEKETITFEKLAVNKKFLNSDNLEVIIGEDTNGNIVTKDLKELRNILVAGTTGSGKSVFLHTLIMSLMAKPCEFVMIDTKQVELLVYNNSPRLVVPVVTDSDEAEKVLEQVIEEMERRYSGSDYLPMVVVIDELSDLIMSNSKISDLLVRIAQKSRAVSIHLIVGLQRPDTTILQGKLKANLPTRVAMKVATGTDSRVIIDQQGAEQLLGRGDLLFSDDNGIQRCHAPYISQERIKSLLTNTCTVG